MQAQQEPSADHVARRSIGLNPIPGGAQLGREPAPTPLRIFHHEPLDERHFARLHFPAAITKLARHGGEDRERKVERKFFFSEPRASGYAAGAMGRQQAAAELRIGSPFHNNN